MSETSTETSSLIDNGSSCSNLKLFLSELIGTFILLAFVNGSSAVAILSAGRDGQPDNLYMCLGSGCGLAIAVICTFRISGAHVNPAISFAFFAMKKTTFKRFLLYASAQYIGAFFGSLCVFGLYSDQIRWFDGGNTTQFDLSLATAKIFATYPNDRSSLVTCAFDQMFGTMLLLIGILGITDKSNLNMPIASQPLAIGLLLISILLGFGLNCGAALNPARDFSPRIVSAICGWGRSVFSVENYLWFWIPIVCPHIGAIIGAFIYQFTLGSFMNCRQYSSLSITSVNYS